MKRLLMASLIVAGCTIDSFAQMSSKPGPEHARLRSLAGTWIVEAEEEGFRYTLRDTCEWFAGEFHLVCRSEGTGAAGSLRGQTIIGYDARQKTYSGTPTTASATRR